MSELRKLNPEELREILESGDFEQLKSTIEHGRVECKGSLYALGNDNSKIEFAKDVSAFANSGGGFLLLGVSTILDPTHGSEVIDRISSFTQDKFEIERHRQVLDSLVYPPIRDIKFEWHASKGTALGIASIHVSPDCAQHRPYLVVKTEIDAKVSGKLIGYFERIETTVPPTTAHQLRQLFKDGMRFGELTQQLSEIHEILARQFAESTEKKSEATIERLIQRAADTRVATGIAEFPSFYLAATPLEDIQLLRIFESDQSPEVIQFDKAPKYRSGGFDLDTQQTSHVVRAELRRRVSTGRRGLDLWRDGTLTFVGRGDWELLGWACKGSDEELLINNVALTEMICLFFGLVIELYKLASPTPKHVRVFFGLLADPDGKRAYKLGNANLSGQFVFDHDWRQAPHAGKMFTVDFPLDGAVAEVEALKLLKLIYNWFGFNDVQIPYVDRTSTPERIDPKLYARRA